MRFRVYKFEYVVWTHHFDGNTLPLHVCSKIDIHSYVK